MTQPKFAVAKEPLIRKMDTFMRGNKRKVTLDMDKDAFLKRGLIESGEPSTFTRKQIQNGLVKCVKNVQSGNGHWPAVRVALPTGSSKAAALRILQAKHQPKTGEPESLLLACLAKYR